MPNRVGTPQPAARRDETVEAGVDQAPDIKADTLVGAPGALGEPDVEGTTPAFTPNPEEEDE